MMDCIPRGVPARLTAGDSWRWSSALPAQAGVSLVVVLRPATGGANVEIPAGVTDGERMVDWPPLSSRDVAPGLYHWAEVLTRAEDGARWTGGTGRVEVLPDPMGAGGDLRTRAERILDAIDARIEGRANADCDAYTIEGRSISRTPLDILLRVRGVYARKVAAERGGGGIEYRRIKF